MISKVPFFYKKKLITALCEKLRISITDVFQLFNYASKTFVCYTYSSAIFNLKQKLC